MYITWTVICHRLRCYIQCICHYWIFLNKLSELSPYVKYLRMSIYRITLPAVGICQPRIIFPPFYCHYYYPLWLVVHYSCVIYLQIKVSTRINICVKCLIFYYSRQLNRRQFFNHDDMTSIANVQIVGSQNFNNMVDCLVCWSLTSLCHSNGHIETMPAREINPFTALTGIRSQFLRFLLKQYLQDTMTSNHQRVHKTTRQTAQPSGLNITWLSEPTVLNYATDFMSSWFRNCRCCSLREMALRVCFTCACL